MLFQNFLKEIWTTNRVQKLCKIIYTDNSKVNKRFIQQIYQEYFPKELSVEVLLDIFHGRERIFRTINKNHPNYRPAKKNLSRLFTLIQKMGHFPTLNKLSVAFNDWCLQYFIVHPSSILIFDKQLKFLLLIGNITLNTLTFMFVAKARRKMPKI
jgi:hypothetical protein